MSTHVEKQHSEVSQKAGLVRRMRFDETSYLRRPEPNVTKDMEGGTSIKRSNSFRAELYTYIPTQQLGDTLNSVCLNVDVRVVENIVRSCPQISNIVMWDQVSLRSVLQSARINGPERRLKVEFHSFRHVGTPRAFVDVFELLQLANVFNASSIDLHSNDKLYLFKPPTIADVEV